MDADSIVYPPANQPQPPPRDSIGEVPTMAWHSFWELTYNIYIIYVCILGSILLPVTVDDDG